MRFNKRDFPEHRVRIIAPTDQRFDAMVSKHFQKKVPSTLKPFAVFIQNEAARTVLAYSLTWEVVRKDGKVISNSAGYSEPGVLMGIETPKDPTFKHTTAIEPNTVKCFSWDSQIQQDDSTTSSFSGENRSEQVQNLAPRALQAMAKLEGQLAESTDITVSIDGVVFDDGTFIGSNAVFFQQLQASVNAKIDLLRQVALAKEQGRLDQVLDSIAAYSLEPDVAFGPKFSADEYYRYFRKLYATEITSTSRVYGKDRVVPNLVQSYHRARPILRKG